MEQDELIELLVRNASFSADTVAIGFQGTNAQKTKAIIKTALEMMVGNGLIELKPANEWPEWLALDPPYSPGDLFNQGTHKQLNVGKNSNIEDRPNGALGV